MESNAMSDIFKWWISLNDFWKKSIIVHIELMKIGVTYEKIINSTKAICNEPIDHIYQNITGIEFKTPSLIEFERALDLTFFYIRSKDCDISDIQPLVILNKLEIIDFSFNMVSDLEPIKNCKGLKILNCECNLIASLKPIQTLNNLIELNFGRNKVSNLDPIKNKPWLTVLKVDQNPIKSLNGIQELTRLEYFDCSDDTGECRIDLNDLNYLINLKKLKRLKMDNPLLWNLICGEKLDGQNVIENMEAVLINCEITY